MSQSLKLRRLDIPKDHRQATEQLNRTFQEYNSQTDALVTSLNSTITSLNMVVTQLGAGTPVSLPYPTTPSAASAVTGAASPASGLASAPAGSVILGNGSSPVANSGALTNGEIVVGSTGGMPVAATLTPVSNQTTVTNASGSITVGLATPVANFVSNSNTPTPWTPTDASGASLVFTGVSVSSTQVGNIQFIYGALTYPATASGATAAIGGLPTTVANQSYAQVPNAIITTAALTIGAVPIQNTKTFEFVTLSGATNPTNAQLSSATVVFAFWYPLA